MTQPQTSEKTPAQVQEEKEIAEAVAKFTAPDYKFLALMTLPFLFGVGALVGFAFYGR